MTTQRQTPGCGWRGTSATHPSSGWICRRRTICVPLNERQPRESSERCRLEQRYEQHAISLVQSGENRVNEFGSVALSAKEVRKGRRRRKLLMMKRFDDDLVSTNQVVVASQNLGPSEATKPVILRGRINPSRAEKPEIWRKYYRPFGPRSLTGAVFRAMTGRTVNPQVPVTCPGFSDRS
jgi:hypothetical protein